MLHGNELFVATSLVLILVGLAIALVERNIFKIVLGFTVADTGVNLLIVSLGFIPGRTAPIIDNPDFFTKAGELSVKATAVVDPIPQALVLTAIVIGVGVTALMLSYVVRLYAATKSLDIGDMGRLKW